MKTPAPTIEYDTSFDNVPHLTWLPWIGADFSRRNSNKRLMIVGESYYSAEQNPEKIHADIKRIISLRTLTRDAVSECCVRNEWPNKTLDAIPKLLFATPHIDRSRFWSDTGFYNFIQRPMDYGKGERPGRDDLVRSWQVFVDVMRIIQPTHCVFIGVLAASRFNQCMTSANITFVGAKRTRRIGRTWARSAALQIDGKTIDLCFVQHSGKHFSWRQWHGYLNTDYSSLMTWLTNEAYTAQPQVLTAEQDQ
jgi:hypothetical protein